MALARLDHLSAEDLPEKIASIRSPSFLPSTGESDEILTLDEIDRRYIDRAIKLLDGNKARAATLLGLDRRTLYRRLEKYESQVRGGAEHEDVAAG